VTNERVTASVVVLGSLNVDLVLGVQSLPVEGETVLGGTLHEHVGGKGANQAVAAARLGASVHLVGRVGDDPYADAVLEAAGHDHVDTSFVRKESGARTGVALILVDKVGRNLIAVAPGANRLVGESDVEAAVGALAVEPTSILVVQCEIPRAAVLAAARAARRATRRVILNAAPARQLFRVPRGAVDVLVVNETEAGSLLRRPVRGLSLAVSAAADLRQQTGAHVVVTAGGRGAALADADTGKTETVGSFRVPVRDSTGAGDAFVGALATALGESADLSEAVRFASAAGAIATTREGAQVSMPRRTEVEGLLEGRSAARSTATPGHPETEPRDGPAP
jgi:ribokinase